MKTLIALLLFAITAIIAAPSYAINHAYQTWLEKNHCTQVEDANGNCPHRTGVEVPELTDKNATDAAEYLIAHGWTIRDGSFHKEGVTLRLRVIDGTVSGQHITP